MRKRTVSGVLWLLVPILGSAFSGCAINRPADDDNPYHLDHPAEKVHGEASVFYGHSAN